MEKERLKEKLANYRNVQTHLWTAMLVTISGSLALLQSFNNLLNKFLVVIGIAIFFFLLNGYLNKNEIIEKLIKKLED